MRDIGKLYVYAFHCRLLKGGLVSNRVENHYSKPMVMIPFSFTKHSPFLAVKGRSRPGKTIKFSLVVLEENICLLCILKGGRIRGSLVKSLVFYPRAFKENMTACDNAAKSLE